MFISVISLAELGDYDGRRHSHGYVSEFRLVPNQTKELEQRISEIHQQQLKGISPTSAELKYLDKVKWHDMYGVDLHPVLVSVNSTRDQPITERFLIISIPCCPSYPIPFLPFPFLVVALNSLLCCSVGMWSGP